MLYAGCCTGHSYKLAAGDGDIEKLIKAWKEEAEKIWELKGLPPTNDDITRLFAAHLTKALEEGYAVDLAAVDYETPDGAMIRHLEENIYHFSAAKNQTQLRQLTGALIDESGKLRTWSQFKKAAFDITDAHVNQWLKAEYELAVAGSQMASKWMDLQTSGATVVEFDVVLDKKTSETCRPLDGIRVLATDPMLDTYWPPNHFFCRTTVRLHHDHTVTPAENITGLPDLKPMFQTNLAKDKLVFPKNHPYYL